MEKVGPFQLCHPELLSVSTLSEILKNLLHEQSCITLPTFKDGTKDELVEIFKRIAMPMPQRKYNLSRNLGKKLNDMRIQRGLNVADYSVDTSKKISETNKCDSETNKRLTSPVKNSQQFSKKIQFSNSYYNDKDMKRKSEISPISEQSKRQKITWP